MLCGHTKFSNSCRAFTGLWKSVLQWQCLGTTVNFGFVHSNFWHIFLFHSMQLWDIRLLWVGQTIFPASPGQRLSHSQEHLIWLVIHCSHLTHPSFIDSASLARYCMERRQLMLIWLLVGVEENYDFIVGIKSFCSLLAEYLSLVKLPIIHWKWCFWVFHSLWISLWCCWTPNDYSRSNTNRVKLKRNQTLINLEYHIK